MGRWTLLVEGERIEVCPRHGRWGRSKVEHPDNIYHGKQDEASRSGLLRTIRGIDQPVDARAAKDEPSREEANEGNMISLCGIGCHDDEDTNDEAEHICNGEPREIRKAEGSMLGGRDGRSHKRDKPCEYRDRDGG